MGNWLCIVNKTNWPIVEKTQSWGVRDRHAEVLKQVRKGDSLVFYVTGRFAVPAIYEVLGAPFESSERVFEPAGFQHGDMFPHRVRIREKLVPRQAVDFRGLVPALDLFPKKQAWNMVLRGKAMLPLSDRDYETIREKLARST